MYAVLSPAKKLHDTVTAPTAVRTQPALLDHTETLMETVRDLSHGDLKSLMKISDNLATLNHKRFQDFATPFTDANATPAGLTFAGDTYLGFDGGSLDADELEWAQDHVGILSGLYGVLRPLDYMQPYRLEMGSRLTNPRGKNLYAFWKGDLTAEIARRVADHDDKTLVNLASNEYIKAVDRKRLETPVVTAAFKEERDGKLRAIMLFVKKARGGMARWIVQNRVDRVEGLKDFAEDGYAFRADLSDDANYVFTR